MYNNEQAIMGSHTTRPEAVRQTQISVQAAELGEKTELLLKQLSELEERLSAVMRPLNAPPVEGNDLEPTPGALAPHADFLRSRNYLLEMAISRLKNILDRIEV